MSDAASVSPSAPATALGVVLEPAVVTTVNPVQTTTYHLKPANNPITFGAGTSIQVTGTAGIAVSGGTGTTYVIANDGYLHGSTYGVKLAQDASIANYGTIFGGSQGITFAATGTLTNAGAISGSTAVQFSGAGVVTNTGTIGARGLIGIVLQLGGSVTNEATGKIMGGVASSAAPLTLANSGYLYNGNTAVSVLDGGTITNSAGATIYGQVIGLQVSQTTQAVSVTNAGTIQGGGLARNTVAVEIDADDAVFSNLKSGDIEGPTISMQIKGNGVTITNAGTINTNSNFGSALIAANDTVVNEQGGRISGYFYGAILDGGSLTNAGSISAQKFDGVLLKAAGAVVNKGAGAITGALYGVSLFAAGSSLTNGGSIVGTTKAGVLISGPGTMSNWGSGTVTGAAGVIFFGGGGEINAGHITGTSQDGVKFINAGGMLANGAGGVISGHPHGVYVTSGAGTITNAGEIVGTSGAGVQLNTGGSVANGVGGAISGTQEGVYIIGAAGTITNAGSISGTTDSILFGGAGDNSLTLQTGSSLIGGIVGSTAAGATNALVLQGADKSGNWFKNFGSLTKDGPANWTLDGGGTFGAATIYGGVLQVGDATHAGAVLVIDGALGNNGIIEVAGGEAHVVGGVTGTGSAAIAAGTLALSSSFTENVAFMGTSGVLELAKSQSYSGTISGFSLTGATSLDLRDIHFTSGTTAATYVDNGSHTGGVLSVTDGTRTAHIHLTGDYSGSSFTTSSDGHGGTVVVDPPKRATTAAQPAVVPFIAAMASFDAGGGHWIPNADPARSSPPLLSATHAR